MEEVSDEAFVTEFAKVCGGELSPMCAAMGGVVMEACSGKFMPIFHSLYFDALARFGGGLDGQQEGH